MQMCSDRSRVALNSREAGVPAEPLEVGDHGLRCAHRLRHVGLRHAAATTKLNEAFDEICVGNRIRAGSDKLRIIVRESRKLCQADGHERPSTNQ